MRRLLTHLALVALFAFLAVVWSFPLVLHLDTHIPGSAAGDNVAFLWNLYWARETPIGEVFSRSPLLFFPFGTELVLHTHTMLSGFLASTVFARVPLVASQNLIILCWLTLNGYTATLLGRDVLGSWSRGIVAGVIFGGSPYVMIHLLGHFNLIAPWGIPLFLLFYRRALRDHSPRWAIAAGLTFGLIAYVDYYYLVYALICGAVVLAVRWWDLAFVRRPHARRSVDLVLYGALLLVGLLIALVLGTGGFAFELAGQTVSMRTTRNLGTIAGLIGMVWLVTRWSFTVRPLQERLETRRDLKPLAVAVLAAAVVLLPLLVAGVQLWLAGDYVAPRRTWKSSPRGVDLLMPILGNPLDAWYGAGVQQFLSRHGIDVMEGVAWFGVVPTLVLWITWRRRNAQWRQDYEWWALLAVFGVWALGPSLYVMGWNTGVLLPQAIAGQLPILSNARMPGRAMVVVYLAGGLLVARHLPAWFFGPRTRIAWVGLVALLVADYLAAPFPLYALDQPAIYRTLAIDPQPGALLELPIGLRDGFGETGRLDSRVLYYQTIHHRAIVGGFVARLSPRITEGYRRMPVMQTLLKLSSGEPVDDAASPDVASGSLKNIGIGFVMLNRNAAPELLRAYVERFPALELVARDAERDLYRLR